MRHTHVVCEFLWRLAIVLVDSTADAKTTAKYLSTFFVKGLLFGQFDRNLWKDEIERRDLPKSKMFTYREAFDGSACLMLK